MSRAILVLVVQIVALLFVATAPAQIDPQAQEIFRDLLRRMPQSMPPALESLLSPPRVSSSRPSFECTKGGSAIAQILCSGEDGARADWELNASAWAHAAPLTEDAREAFWRDHEDWFKSLAKSCKLTQISVAQRSCVISAYQHRAKTLQSNISPDGRAEVALTPEQRAAIQTQLISLGYFTAEADGEFGPKTREAIRKYKQSMGHEFANYFTADERQGLLTRPIAPSQATQSSASPEIVQTFGQPPNPIDRYVETNGGCGFFYDGFRGEVSNSMGREFSRPDRLPYGKPYIEWTPSDYENLRAWSRRCLANIPPARRDAALVRVDSALMGYLQRQRVLVEQTRRGKIEQEVAERRKAEIEKQKIAAAEQRNAEIQKSINLSDSYQEKFASLEANPVNKQQLEELLAHVRGLYYQSLSAELLPQDRLASLRELIKEVEQKITGATSIEKVERRTRYIETANTLAGKYSSELRAFHILPAVLDSTIYVEDGLNPNPSAFMSLRQWLALILDQGWAVGAGVQDKKSSFGNDNYIVTLKRAGERTITIIFNSDSGDLFLDVLGKGTSIEPLLTGSDKLVAGQFIKQLVKYQE